MTCVEVRVHHEKVVPFAILRTGMFVDVAR